MSIKTSSDTYRNLSSEHKKAIQDIISVTFNGQTIEEVDSPATEGVCEIACDVALGIALAACQAIPFPGNIACSALANAAHTECVDAC